MDYSSYPTDYATAPTVDPVFMTVYWAAIVAISILSIIGLWKIFVKAGKPGWASIVPLYNTIVLLQIVGYSGWYVIAFFIPIVNIIFWIMVYHKLSKAFGHGIGYTLGLIFLSPIFLLMLGFGSDTYTAPKGGSAVTPQKPADKPAAETPTPAKPTEEKKA